MRFLTPLLGLTRRGKERRTNCKSHTQVKTSSNTNGSEENAWPDCKKVISQHRRKETVSCGELNKEGKTRNIFHIQRTGFNGHRI
jgi:hypothetical protein